MLTRTYIKMCKNLGDPKNPSMYEHFTEMNLKNSSVIFITLGLPLLTLKLIIAEKTISLGTT